MRGFVAVAEFVIRSEPACHCPQVCGGRLRHERSCIQPEPPVWTPGGGLNYQLLAQDGDARRGRFVTAHV